MLNTAEALPPRLSAGIHYSPLSSHRALSAGPGATPRSPHRNLCCLGDARRPLCFPLPRPRPRPRPPGSAPEPRTQRYGNPPPAVRRLAAAVRSRGAQARRSGDASGWGGPQRGRRRRGSPARPLHPPAWQVRREMRALRSGSALEGATCPAVRAFQWSPLCGERSPPGPSTCHRLSVEWVCWGDCFAFFFFSSLFFPPFGPFPLLCRDSVEWDLDEGSSLAEPLVCSQLWHMPCVYCLCMALVGPHAPSLLFIAGFAFCVCSE